MTSLTPPTSSALQLRVDGLSVGCRLIDVTLALSGGTLTVVVGEIGAGKSTLRDALAGVVAARDVRAGRVLLAAAGGAGVDVRSLAPRDRARMIASLGQKSVDVDDVSGAERIAHGLVPRKGQT